MAKPEPTLMYDGPLVVATGKSRWEKKWVSKEWSWAALVARLSVTKRTAESFADYMKMTRDEQDAIKDVGGFVGGSLKAGHRRAGHVAFRQLLTLDADHVDGDLWGAVTLLFDGAACVYSTHKHSKERPRLRLVLPLARPVSAEEYPALARRFADDLGIIDWMDDTTYQPHRLMYWPSTAADGSWLFESQDGPWLDPDEVLARYDDWQDVTTWPMSSRQDPAALARAAGKKQADPLGKEGLVGAFCRAYDIPTVIETFLPDVYEPAGDGRYTFIGGTTSGGLVLYEDGKFAYSHHSTDPAGGKLLNAFDLVRVHLFGEKDKDADSGDTTASTKAMREYAQQDDAVMEAYTEARRASAVDDFEDDESDVDGAEEAEDTAKGKAEPEAEATDSRWMRKLNYDPDTGSILSNAHNIRLVLRNDPKLRGKLGYNAFTGRPAVLGRLPWRKLSHWSGPVWADADDAALRSYLSMVYGIKGPGVITDETIVEQQRNTFHPVRDYLGTLEWDGIARLERLFIDYLGAHDTPYVREVTRKAFVAAVARVMTPGCKFDYMPVLVGPQGIGKSLLLTKMGHGWFSDSLTTVQGKEAYEQLHGVWLMEIGELSATRKADVEAIKSFLSSQADKYRPAYGRHLVDFPRQTVFFGTTNDDTFLKDRTGNRRFWPIVVGGPRELTPWDDLSEWEVGQLWGEAVTLWQGGETLKLSDAGADMAREEQERHTDEDPRKGLIEDYLERLLPEDWKDRDVFERRQFIRDGHVGTVRRDRVCTLEIWCELFGNDPGKFPESDKRAINDILRSVAGWSKAGKLRFGSSYGVQIAYLRNED